MSDAPHRIWAIPAIGLWNCDQEDEPGEVSYILATPAALAASPEVAALIREAEARVWEAAARKVKAGTAVFTVKKDQPAGFNAAETLRAASDALLAEAAALRGKETT